MLHCADRSFYVGHRDDLDVRIAQHVSGAFRGYTSTRLPVVLVWCDEFPSRYEALCAERQIKGMGARQEARADPRRLGADQPACAQPGEKRVGGGFDRLSPNGLGRMSRLSNSVRAELVEAPPFPFAPP